MDYRLGIKAREYGGSLWQLLLALEMPFKTAPWKGRGSGKVGGGGLLFLGWPVAKRLR